MVHKMNLKRSSYSSLPEILPPSGCVMGCNMALVVDDNMFNIMSIQMLLVKVKNLPRGVDKALDGLKGLQMIRKKRGSCCKKPYKLVIIDLNMPNLDGIGMIQQLREEVQINDTIFIMASCQPENTVEFKSHGFKYYLQKPFKVDALLEIAAKEFE